MDDTCQLEKTLWSEADFELMSWHDCPIHAIAFSNNHQLLFDIDYIFKWILTKNKKHYKFCIAPCTLVFENVYNIAFESNHSSLVIDNISRERPQVPKNAAYIGRDIEYDWIVETTAGEINFTSVGFKQYVRQSPFLLRTQHIEVDKRGGVSFGTTFSS